MCNLNRSNVFRSVFAGVALAMSVAASAASLGDEVRFDIQPQALDTALLQFSRQTGITASAPTASLAGKKTTGVSGKYVAEDALKRLLANSGLVYRLVNSKTVVIASKEDAAGVSAAGQMRLAAAEVAGKADQPAGDQAEHGKGIPEILVEGRRSLNADIRRSLDEPQPYVIFESEEIERSQSANLEEFFRTRLPMNTTSTSEAQLAVNGNTRSSINLRGLGSNQTLILVDGRRMPSVGGGNLTQGDINGIPLGAIERIEVLPSTAGGIYGGSATGGVINIILRRDFKGLEVRARYGNTFDTDAGSVEIDLTGGFSLEGGRTQVMLTASRSSQNALMFGDRDFARRARTLLLENNPDAILNAFTPPSGATVNIATPLIYDPVYYASTGKYRPGLPLVLKPEFGGASLGSSVTHLPVGYLGAASDNGAALIANAGTLNLDLPGGSSGEQLPLVAAPTRNSAAVSLRRSFGRNLELFVDASAFGNAGSSYQGFQGLVNNLPASAPNNPFQQSINVTFPVLNLGAEARREYSTLRATGGLIARLPRRWTAGMDYTWGRSRTEYANSSFLVDAAARTALNTGLPAPDGRPALDALQEGNTYPIDFTPYLLPSPNALGGPIDTVLRNLVLRFSGPVADLPGGPLTAAVLLERREESAQDAVVQGINASTRQNTYTFYPHRSQNADSYYLELRAPMVSDRNPFPWLRELELQASVRRDVYTTNSDGSRTHPVPSRNGPFPALTYVESRFASQNYTVGLRYAPIRGLALRASYGGGFLPPSVTQTVTQMSIGSTSFLGYDPKRGGEPNYASGVPFDAARGGSPNLKPENSRSWSFGVILTPDALPGFRVAVDCTQIEKTGEIGSIRTQELLDYESHFPGRIVRGSNLPGDPAGWAGPITFADLTLVNLARTSVKAYDIRADYPIVTQRFGTFHLQALATWQLHYRNKTSITTPQFDSAGYTDGPLEWRGNAGIRWERGPFSLGWNTQYYDSYYVFSALASASTIELAIRELGSARVPRQYYHDLLAQYRIDGVAGFAGGRLANVDLSVGIQNLFDTSPPILPTAYPTNNPYSNYGDPRLRRYTVSLRKSF